MDTAILKYKEHTTFGFNIEKAIPTLDELIKLVYFCTEAGPDASVLFPNENIRLLVYTMIKAQREYHAITND